MMHEHWWAQESFGRVTYNVCCTYDTNKIANAPLARKEFA